MSSSPNCMAKGETKQQIPMPIQEAERKRRRIKTVPLNIGELLTDVGLAFWIMDDGGSGSNGTLNLHTESYTFNEVNLLIRVLKKNFNVDSRISLKRPGQWIIVIPKKEVFKVDRLTINYMHPSMIYKLGK